MAKKPIIDQRGGQRTVRCAVYTRKSTEEGLDQAFNSLDAQREACEAYILSQRHEGWTLVKDSYDDGGFSGGNMERPGLKRLLADIEADKVNVIVVYKVDRLTRSLADFAKIVDVLDDRDASFVSVTQSFNTTTSMGRLTLNVLLSFAQFEREVTGERIRDKIAASKAKGMWMGGTPPLGYDVVDKKLVVNDIEAEQVRHIMQRYVAVGSGRALLQELERTGYRTKKSTSRGGIPFMRGPLFHILNNRVYLGATLHQGVSYPGEHQAIVGQELWDAVQQTMAGQRVVRLTQANVRESSLLAGRIFDGDGRRMSPSHANKAGRRYRYYITPASELAVDARPPWRVPAHDLEAGVVRRLQKMLKDRSAIASAIGGTGSSAATLNSAIHLARKLADDLGSPDHRRGAITKLVRIVRLADDHIAVGIDGGALRALLDIEVIDEESEDVITLVAPAAKVRRGKDVKLVIADHDGRADDGQDDLLVALLAEARDAYVLVLSRPEHSIKEVAREVGKCRTRFGRLVRVALLAPDIVQGCIEGKQPMRLTAKALLETDIPIGWTEQRKMLGFS